MGSGIFGTRLSSIFLFDNFVELQLTFHKQKLR